MIANITTILYILNVSDEIISNGTLQKGTAVSRVDEDEGLQIYKYTNYLTSVNQADSVPNDDVETTLFEKDKMYLITGKFSVSQDDSINVMIISSVHITLNNKENMPIMKPTVHFVGKTMNYAQLTDVGYTLQIQVKPYLSKEQFNPFLVNLTHPVNGRFKNALMKAKKNSTVHTTGLFFLANKELYCEILEFQFISGTKIESENTISVPWKSKTDSNPSSSKTKSVMDRRIDLIRQNLEKTPPSSPLSDTSKQSHKKRKTLSTKTSEISKLLLSQDQQDQPVEIIDSDQEIYNNEEIEDDDENIEGNNKNDGAPANISTRTRNSKRKIK